MPNYRTNLICTSEYPVGLQMAKGAECGLRLRRLENGNAFGCGSRCFNLNTAFLRGRESRVESRAPVVHLQSIFVPVERANERARGRFLEVGWMKWTERERSFKRERRASEAQCMRSGYFPHGRPQWTFPRLIHLS